MASMTDLPEFDELLSAYLDDELSAEEKLRVEQSLRENRDLHHTLEELRSLRAAIQALPQLKLDEDFTRRVLERAGQSLLETETSNDRQVAACPEDNHPAGSAGWSRKPGLQSFAVACAALAALILVAVVLPHRWAGKKVALQAPADRSDAIVEGEGVAAAGKATEDFDVAYQRNRGQLAESGFAGELSVDMEGSTETSRERRGGISKPLPQSAPARAPATPMPHGVAVSPSKRSSDQPIASPPSPASGQRWSQLGTRAAGVGLPPAAASDYVVFVSGSTRRRMSDSFRAALEENRIALTPTAVEDAARRDEAEVQMVLVEAPLEQIQAAVQTLGADQRNVQSIVALSPDGEGHRVTNAASGFGGMAGGGLSASLSWRDALEETQQNVQEPRAETTVAERHSAAPTSETGENTQSERNTPRHRMAEIDREAEFFTLGAYDAQQESAQRTKDEAAQIVSDSFGQGAEQTGRGRAWFFRYSADDQGNASVEPRANSELLRRLHRRSPDTIMEPGMEAEELAAQIAGHVVVPSEPVTDGEDGLRPDRRALRERILNLELPDAFAEESTGEEIHDPMAGTGQMAAGRSLSKGVPRRGDSPFDLKMVRVLFVLQPIESSATEAASEEPKP